MADAGQHQQLKGVLSETDSEAQQGVPEEGGGRGGDDRNHCHQVHSHGVHGVSVRLCDRGYVSEGEWNGSGCIITRYRKGHV